MDFEKEFLVSINAYNRLYPGSFFRRPLKAGDIQQARSSLVFVAFRMLAPLAKGTDDHFAILKAIEQDVEEIYCLLMAGDGKRLSCRFSEAKKAAEKKILERFERYFAEEKKKLR